MIVESHVRQHVPGGLEPGPCPAASWVRGTFSGIRGASQQEATVSKEKATVSKEETNDGQGKSWQEAMGKSRQEAIDDCMSPSWTGNRHEDRALPGPAIGEEKVSIERG